MSATGEGGSQDFRNLGHYPGATLYQGNTIYCWFDAQPTQVSQADLDVADVRLRQLPENHIPEPAPLPEGSLIGIRYNPAFVGRECNFTSIAQLLKQGGTAAIGQTVAATGMGGVGKTQLAVEVAHRYGPYFAGGVHFLNVGDPTNVENEIVRCGEHMGVIGDEDAHEAAVRKTLSAWQSHLPRLLIFDNCEDPDLFDKLCPPTGGARVLVTTRRQDWGDPTRGVQAVPLGVLTRHESIELLLFFRPDLENARDDLDALAEELGDLPLALHIAGSYLQRYRQSPSGAPEAYLGKLRNPGPLEQLAQTATGHQPTGHDLDVAKTFKVSFDRLEPDDQADALARSVFALAACLTPGEPIPRWLLEQATNEAKGGIADLGFEDALIRLSDLGLIERETDGRVTLHRLVAAFGTAYAVDDSVQEAVEAVVARAAKYDNDHEMPGPLAAWVTHLRTVAEAAASRNAGSASTLLILLGYHLQMIADFQDAYDCYELPTGPTIARLRSMPTTSGVCSWRKATWRTPVPIMSARSRFSLRHSGRTIRKQKLSAPTSKPLATDGMKTVGSTFKRKTQPGAG